METTLENAALNAVRNARWFVEEFRNTPIEMDGLRRYRVAPTLERLEIGELFHRYDETMLDLIEKALIGHLNGLYDGYGTHAHLNDTRYDQLFCPDLDKARLLMQQWKAFKSARQYVIDLRCAGNIADVYS